METWLAVVVVAFAIGLAFWFVGRALLRGAIAIVSCLDRRWRG